MSTEKYSQSGLSANATFDSRDNVVNPYEGQLAAISLRAFPEFLGSTTSASQLWMEYRTYVNLDKTGPAMYWLFGLMVGLLPVALLPIWLCLPLVGICLPGQVGPLPRVESGAKTWFMLKPNGVFLYKEIRINGAEYCF
jgi:hypothetical protein